MRDRIISNVLIKMGNRIKKKELDYLENVLVEEFRDVQIKKESTELTEYNDSLRKLKDTFLATLIVENKSNRTIEQYNLHLTQFVDYFTAKEAKDIDATDIRGFLSNIILFHTMPCLIRYNAIDHTFSLLQLLAPCYRANWHE